jgi:hypothetical protein
MLETKSAPFTFVKQGIFYFSRRVPSDLSHHYTADRIMYSLRTRSASVARGGAIPSPMDRQRLYGARALRGCGTSRR